MGSVVALVPQTVQQGRFGLCPRCGNVDGPISIHGQQWLYCSTHHLCWFVGERVIGGWQLGADRIFPDVMETERLKGLWETRPFYPGKPDGPGEAA